MNYEEKYRHLHGHNGRAMIKIGAVGLDERGMVVDFKDFKTVIARWVDVRLDHRMLLNREDPVVEYF